MNKYINHFQHQKQYGFTVVELMVVIAIMAIITVWAVPSFSNFIAKRKVDAALNMLVSATQLARSQAITLGRNVSVCPIASESSTSCSAGDWSNGWMVFVPKKDGAVESVLQVYPVSSVNIAQRGSMTIFANGLMGEPSTDMVFVVIPTGVSTDAQNNLKKTLTFSAIAMAPQVLP